MQSILTTKVHGLRELEEALEELGKEAGEAQLAGSVRDAMKIFKDQAKAYAPVGTRLHWIGLKSRDKMAWPGNLRDFGFRVSKSRNQKFACSYILRYSGNAFYGKFFELGTAKMRRQPMIQPAFDIKATDALNRFKERLAERIEKVRAQQEAR